MSINIKSPVPFAFSRSGGSDIRSEIQIWIKKPVYSPSDRPIARLTFGNPTLAIEAQDAHLAPGNYICVFLAMVCEARDGSFGMQVHVGNQPVYTQQGDVNTTPAPRDLRNFKSVFELTAL